MSRGFLDEDVPEGEAGTDDAREVEITGRIVSRAGRVLRFDSGDRRIHDIPLSVVRGSTQSSRDVVTLRLPEWFAKKRGLI